MNTKDPEKPNPPAKKRNAVASIVVTLAGIASGIYILNPGWGVFELIPDNIPIIGNLDEAGAVAILISCLAYWGIDAGAIFGRGGKSEKDEKAAKGKVIES